MPKHQNSLRKIDRELKTTKNDNDVLYTSMYNAWNKSKDELLNQDKDKLEKLGIHSFIKEYLETVTNLDVAEDAFFLKYKDLCTQCKEERYLDELTEQIDTEYRNLKRVQDSLLKREIELMKDDKVTNLLIAFHSNLLDNLNTGSWELSPKLLEEVENEYKQLLLQFLKKLQFLIESTITSKSSEAIKLIKGSPKL